MCWFGERKHKRVAKEDIRCKKVFYRQPGHIRNRYVSPVMKTMYVQGQTYESNIVLTCGTGYWKIDEGIHCYSMDKVKIERSIAQCGERLVAKIPFATDNYGNKHHLCTYYGNDIGMQAVVLECIIPKGSVYYENLGGEIVTEKLIIGEEITNIDK